MALVSISIPDELLTYIDQKVGNRNELIESLLKQWQQQQEQAALAMACSLVDELALGWESEWQKAAIMDWEVAKYI